MFDKQLHTSEEKKHSLFPVQFSWSLSSTLFPRLHYDSSFSCKEGKKLNLIWSIAKLIEILGNCCFCSSCSRHSVQRVVWSSLFLPLTFCGMQHHKWISTRSLNPWFPRDGGFLTFSVIILANVFFFLCTVRVIKNHRYKWGVREALNWICLSRQRNKTKNNVAFKRFLNVLWHHLIFSLCFGWPMHPCLL